MSMAFLRMFKARRAKPATPAPQDEPTWGDTRIVRFEHAGGQVYYIVQVFGWVGPIWGTLYRNWTALLFVRGLGPIEFPTVEEAKAALDAHLAKEAAKVLKSQTVVWPAAPSSGDAP
jgi:hypothetical protein